DGVAHAACDTSAPTSSRPLRVSAASAVAAGDTGAAAHTGAAAAPGAGGAGGGTTPGATARNAARSGGAVFRVADARPMSAGPTASIVTADRFGTTKPIPTPIPASGRAIASGGPNTRASA